MYVIDVNVHLGFEFFGVWIRYFLSHFTSAGNVGFCIHLDNIRLDTCSQADGAPLERNSEKTLSENSLRQKKCSFQLLIFWCYVSFREGCNNNQVEEWDSTLKSCTGFGFNLRIWYQSLIYIGMWIFRPGFQSPPGWHFIRLMVQKSQGQPPFGCIKPCK